MIPAAKTRKVDYDWGQMEWLYDATLDANAALSLARMTLNPGSVSDPHCHDTCQEVIHVLSGEIRQAIGDGRHDLRAGDSVLVPAGQSHHSANRGEIEAVLLIAYSDGTRDYRSTS